MELAIFEPKPRQRARQSPVVNKVTKASSEQESTKSVETPENQESQKQPVEKKSIERMEKKNEGDSFDLDKQLRELLREKEIVSTADKHRHILYRHIFFFILASSGI